MLLSWRHEEMSGPYLEAIRRGFPLARELGQRCGPAHLLVGVAEGDGPAAAALDPGQGRSLLRCGDGRLAGPRRGDRAASPYGGLGHLHMQAQGAAMALAESRGERVGAEHCSSPCSTRGLRRFSRRSSWAGLDPAR